MKLTTIIIIIILVIFTGAIFYMSTNKLSLTSIVTQDDKIEWNTDISCNVVADCFEKEPTFPSDGYCKGDTCRFVDVGEGALQ